MIAHLFIPLIALALGTTLAAAQDAAAPPAAERAAAAAVDFPWDTITAQWTERRYKVEAIRFKARDESGADWWGSDEVMAGTFDAEGFTASDEIGDIDSGDTHDFDPAVSCIIGVRPGIATLGKNSVCDEAGKPGPFSFKVELWEKDISPFGGFCAVVAAAPGQHVGPHCSRRPARRRLHRLARAVLPGPRPRVDAPERRRQLHRDRRAQPLPRGHRRLRRLGLRPTTASPTAPPAFPTSGPTSARSSWQRWNAAESGSPATPSPPVSACSPRRSTARPSPSRATSWPGDSRAEARGAGRTIARHSGLDRVPALLSTNRPSQQPRTAPMTPREP